MQIGIEIAGNLSAGASIQRFFDLFGKRDIFDQYFGQRESVLLKIGRDLSRDKTAKFLIVTRQIKCRYIVLPQDGGKFGNDEVCQLRIDLISGEVAIRSGDLLDELFGILYSDLIGAKSAEAYHVELRVSDHNSVFGSPFEIYESLGVDEIDLCLERRVKSMIPVLQ